MNRNLGQQFINVQDAVHKYDKIDQQPEPMEGLGEGAQAHSRGRDWRDLMETKQDYHPGHTAMIVNSVAREGVKRPIGIDRTTSPPTISDGHTRLMAAYLSGQRRIPYVDKPVGQATDRDADRTEHGLDPDQRYPGHLRWR